MGSTHGPGNGEESQGVTTRNDPAAESLRRRLEVAAKRNGRSMNAEIIHRLDRSIYEEGAEFLASGKRLTIEAPKVIEERKIEVADLLRQIVEIIEAPDGEKK